MEYFRRSLGYVKVQYKAVTASILCAFFAAALFSLSLGAMLPLMKVMIGEEGLSGWVGRAIVKQRCGIGFRPLPAREYMLAADDAEQLSQAKLRIELIEHRSLADGKGLLQDDQVLAVTVGAIQQTVVDAGRDEILTALSKAPAGEITLRVLHENEEQEDVRLEMGPRPFYSPLADRLLAHMAKQADDGPKFKRRAIVTIIFLMLAATLARCALRFGQEYLIGRVAVRSVMQFRQDGYARTIRRPLSFFSEEGVSDTMSRLVQDSMQVHAGITTLFGKMVREPFKIILVAALALKINAPMTLVTMLVAPVAAVAIGRLGRKMKRATRRTLENWARLMGHLQGSLLAIRVVKGYHQERYEEGRLAQINYALFKQQKRMAKIQAASGPALEALGMVAASVGMVFAAYMLTSAVLPGQKSPMAVPDFIALVGLLAAMAESGRKLGDVWPRLQTANAAAERVYRLIDAPIEEDAPGAAALPRLARSLEMRDVSFSYPNTKTATLSDINLAVEAGQTVAVVGPNGSGKTTLLSLIPRFYVPSAGQILIDGQDISQVTIESLRGQIGIVTQRTLVFNDTIKANIAYGCPDATEEQIVAAAQQAYAHEFIEQTSDGYETTIGEQGARLSGGQLQRLAIARAILRNPALLLFDEATSQIDSDSEAKIQQAVLRFSQGRTCVIVAHRLSTIVKSDKIIVLDRGMLVAQGGHEELLASCDLYRQLYEMQFGMSGS